MRIEYYWLILNRINVGEIQGLEKIVANPILKDLIGAPTKRQQGAKLNKIFPTEDHYC